MVGGCFLAVKQITMNLWNKNMAGYGTIFSADYNTGELDHAKRNESKI